MRKFKKKNFRKNHFFHKFYRFRQTNKKLKIIHTFIKNISFNSIIIVAKYLKYFLNSIILTINSRPTEIYANAFLSLIKIILKLELRKILKN